MSSFRCAWLLFNHPYLYGLKHHTNFQAPPGLPLARDQDIIWNRILSFSNRPSNLLINYQDHNHRNKCGSRILDRFSSKIRWIGSPLFDLHIAKVLWKGIGFLFLQNGDTYILDFVINLRKDVCLDEIQSSWDLDLQS